jgi:hypothetical protein
LAPSIRQSLFSPLEEAVDTNDHDPAADVPLGLRDCLSSSNLTLKAGSAMSWYTQILTKLRDLNSSGGTEELRSFTFTTAKSAGGVVPPSSAGNPATSKQIDDTADAKPVAQKRLHKWVSCVAWPAQMDALLRATLQTFYEESQIFNWPLGSARSLSVGAGDAHRSQQLQGLHRPTTSLIPLPTKTSHTNFF